ncbi:hypothetical protein ENBRE01_2954 [Enteropsectra breve]|nr:hypothetical protein ENBRE01_2954 [Enteropsectra breve]
MKWPLEKYKLQQGKKKSSVAFNAKALSCKKSLRDAEAIDVDPELFLDIHENGLYVPHRKSRNTTVINYVDANTSYTEEIDILSPAKLELFMPNNDGKTIRDNDRKTIGETDNQRIFEKTVDEINLEKINKELNSFIENKTYETSGYLRKPIELVELPVLKTLDADYTKYNMAFGEFMPFLFSLKSSLSNLYSSYKQTVERFNLQSETLNEIKSYSNQLATRTGELNDNIGILKQENAVLSERNTMFVLYKEELDKYMLCLRQSLVLKNSELIALRDEKSSMAVENTKLATRIDSLEAANEEKQGKIASFRAEIVLIKTEFEGILEKQRRVERLSKDIINSTLLKAFISHFEIIKSSLHSSIEKATKGALAIQTYCTEKIRGMETSYKDQIKHLKKGYEQRIEKLGDENKENIGAIAMQKENSLKIRQANKALESESKETAAKIVKLEESVLKSKKEWNTVKSEILKMENEHHKIVKYLFDFIHWTKAELNRIKMKVIQTQEMTEKIKLNALELKNENNLEKVKRHYAALMEEQRLFYEKINRKNEEKIRQLEEQLHKQVDSNVWDIFE